MRNIEYKISATTTTAMSKKVRGVIIPNIKFSFRIFHEIDHNI
jgi:hypothetical protein